MNIFKKISLITKIIKAVKLIEQALDNEEYKNIKDKAFSLVDDVKKQVPEVKEILDEIKVLFA